MLLLPQQQPVSRGRAQQFAWREQTEAAGKVTEPTALSVWMASQAGCWMIPLPGGTEAGALQGIFLPENGREQAEHRMWLGLNPRGGKDAPCRKQTGL